MAERVTRQRVGRQEDDIQQHDNRANAYSKTSVKKESVNGVLPEKEQKDETCIQKITMKILQNKREFRLSRISMFGALADGASGRVEKKSPIVSLAIVVASCPESQRKRQD